MTKPPSSPRRAGRLWDALFGAALALPSGLVAAVVLVALSAAAGAAAPGRPACAGASLLPSLEASGRLAALKAEADAVPNGRGKLFRIEAPGLATSWLYGTMHMSDPRVLDLDDGAEAALDGAERLVIETTDILDGGNASLAVLARPDLMNLPAGRTLGDYLGPEERRLVEARLAALGIPFGSIQTLQPWFFSVALLLPACEAERQAAGGEVLDAAIAGRAKAKGRPVLGLETGIEQLEAMASLPMDLQVDSLLATLELKSEMPDVFETMIELYRAGDIALLSGIAEAAMPLSKVPAESVEAYAAFEERIVILRNRTMAERLRPILREGGAFVAVGALHLPGETGLVELLKAEGYAVARADSYQRP